MKIETITVNAGRTFNHPYENYSNLRADVTIVAKLDESEGLTPESVATATKRLQKQAETAVEAHKQQMLRDLQLANDRANKLDSISRLRQTVARDSARLKELEEDIPQELPMLIHDEFDGIPF